MTRNAANKVNQKPKQFVCFVLLPSITINHRITQSSVHSSRWRWSVECMPKCPVKLIFISTTVWSPVAAWSGRCFRTSLHIAVAERPLANNNALWAHNIIIQYFNDISLSCGCERDVVRCRITHTHTSNIVIQFAFNTYIVYEYTAST